MSLLDRIHACNRWNPKDFVPFGVDGARLGHCRRSFAAALASAGTDFVQRDDALQWVSAPADFTARTQALAAICADLVASGLISHLHGEQYPLTAGRREDACCLIDRACAPYFGARAFGQHLNGYVRRPDGLHLWIGRRAANRRVAPNQLDNMVAGGLPWGIALPDNLRKECWEEAQIPATLADRARPVGSISYCRDSEHGLKPDLIYCYDLELPADFVPRCSDGEVAAFYLWPLEQVIRTVSDTTAFKLNCNLVIIDFLLRHGLITPAHPDYSAITAGLYGLAPTAADGVAIGGSNQDRTA